MAPNTDIDPKIQRPLDVSNDAINDCLTGIANLPENHYWALEPNDELYIEPTESVVVLRDQLRPGDYDRGDRAQFADFFTLDGRRLHLKDRPAGWYEEQAEIRDPGAHWFIHNCATRLGNDFLMIGRGIWYVRDHVTVNGEPAVEFVTQEKFLSEVGAEERAKQQEFLDQYPELQRPEWAKHVFVNPPEEPDEELTVEQNELLRLGTVEFTSSDDDFYVTQTALIDPETREITWQAPGIIDPNGRPLELDKAKTQIASLQSAVALVESIERGA